MQTVLRRVRLGAKAGLSVLLRILNTANKLAALRFASHTHPNVDAVAGH